MVTTIKNSQKVAHNKKGTPGYYSWLNKCRRTRECKMLDAEMEARYAASATYNNLINLVWYEEVC